ncbi:hypothetical protein, partial [Thioalkalivibrio sp.]|uniref:hypothetical protein n=1 Tax=Thioalkalivibrio sp. TaxID=2093813 RepID=UPI0012D5BF43
MNKPSVHATTRGRGINPAIRALAVGAVLFALAIPGHTQDENAQARQAETQAELQAVQERYEEARDELEQLRASHEILEAELSTARSEQSDLGEQLALRDAEISELESQIETAQ